MGYEMTLSDHAEVWWKEQGYEVPNRLTKEWDNMYEHWIDYAFGPAKEDEEL